MLWKLYDINLVLGISNSGSNECLMIRMVVIIDVEVID